MDTFNITTTILAGWIILQAMNISRLRFKERVRIGHGDKLSLKKAIRSHMNSIEQIVPFVFLLFVATNSSTASASVLCYVSIAFCVGRLIHAFSFYKTSDPLRQMSAGLSYAAIIVLFGFNLIHFL